MKEYRLHKKSDTVPLNPSALIMPWGKYRNQYLSTLPDDYLMMLEDGFNTVRRGKVCSQGYKVPSYLMDCARQLLIRRGYKKKGERWEKE